MKAMTGSFFSVASRRMRWPISADCTADPPGELMASATALAPRMPKARASSGAADSTESPRAPRRLPDVMAPVRRTTGTVGPRRRRFLIHSSMAGTLAAGGLEGKRCGVTQDRLGLIGITPVGLVQDKRFRFSFA